MNRTTWVTAPIVFTSGWCALIYQTVWTRELRLVFGASTAASSAVIAIFIAGLGFGGLWFGRRVERTAQPLRYYAKLELGIAIASALTPALLELIRPLYVLSGGSLALGMAGSSVVRLVLTTLVLGPATWLMGGTLPAVSRAVETDRDSARSGVALLYGLNTLGAVAGAALSTFVLLEHLGNHTSLWLAALVNVLVSGVAWFASSKLEPAAADSGATDASASQSEPAPAPAQDDARAVAPPRLIFASAAIVGFAFFLMELVWYRMLGPLLGGTVFTFGLILAVALAGIGAGSAFYAAFMAGGRARLSGFAISCALEAVCIAAPYALGDRIAVWAALIRPLGSLGFGGFVFGWTGIAAIVVLPAAFVSGVQFPMLISLLGSGRTRVARDVGATYAANTLGAILGALAGGFGMIPALGALGCWRLVCAVLGVWAVVIGVFALFQKTTRLGSVWVFGFAGLTLALMFAQGPTAAWRHSPIGAGRVRAQVLDSPNTIQQFLNEQRRGIDWQIDGIESTIGINHYDGVGFIVNGKSDGNARLDAGTQVMGGLVGAALVPRVKRAMVIGLGTGSTAGWLGMLPEIERVDVAEIEPAILNVAKRCEPVNESVLRNPKVHIHRGDARELLAVSREKYDVIFSEPSNPYRAGVASLYTREFYAAVRKRLAPGGVFVQWLQAYDADRATLGSVYATLNAVYPHVETWYGMPHDLLLVSSMHAPVYDTAKLRARVTVEPFIRAMRISWSTDSLEGFLGHYIANPAFTRAVAKRGAPINTDDRSPVEFGFARTARGGGYSADRFFADAYNSNQNRPSMRGEKVDWDRVDYERGAFAFISAGIPPIAPFAEKYHRRTEMLTRWSSNDFQGALAVWDQIATSGEQIELLLIERHVLAELMAYYGGDVSEPWVTTLVPEQPTLALALRAVWLARHNDMKQATDVWVQALHQYRIDPWPLPGQMVRALNYIQLGDPAHAQYVPKVIEALSQPFAAHVNQSTRERALVNLALTLGPMNPACIASIADLEPHPEWSEKMLQFRATCYDKQNHPLEKKAADDLAAFRRAEEE